MSMRCWACSTLGSNGKCTTNFDQKRVLRKRWPKPIREDNNKTNCREIRCITFVRIRQTHGRYQWPAAVNMAVSTPAYWKHGEVLDKLLFAFHVELCSMGWVGANPRDKMGTDILRTCGLFILQTLHETRYNRVFVLKSNGIFTLFQSTYVFSKILS